MEKMIKTNVKPHYLLCDPSCCAQLAGIIKGTRHTFGNTQMRVWYEVKYSKIYPNGAFSSSPMIFSKTEIFSMLDISAARRNPYCRCRN